MRLSDYRRLRRSERFFGDQVVANALSMGDRGIERRAKATDPIEADGIVIDLRH